MNARVEWKLTVSATVDVDALIREFDDEWAEFLGGDEDTPEARLEFVRESAQIMGLDFAADEGWCSEFHEHEDISVYKGRP